MQSSEFGVLHLKGSLFIRGICQKEVSVLKMLKELLKELLWHRVFCLMDAQVGKLAYLVAEQICEHVHGFEG